MKHGLVDGQVPHWLRFSHITTGYRLGGTVADAVRSAFRWHNETINIWTMVTSLVAGTMFMIFSEADDIVPMFSMWLGQALHHPFSIAYHTCMPLSEEVFHRCRALDISFILVMNTFATLGLAWAACGRTVGIICASACALVALVGISRVRFNHKEQRREARAETVALIGVTAMCYYIPVIARAVVAARERLFLSHAFIGAVVMVLSHGLAALLYVTHFPQCIAPRGHLDKICTSQMLIHVLVTGVYLYGYVYIKHV